MNKNTIQFFLDHTFQLPANNKLANKYKLPKPHQTMKTFHGFASYKKINQTKQLKIVLNKKTQNTNVSINIPHCKF